MKSTELTPEQKLVWNTAIGAAALDASVLNSGLSSMIPYISDKVDCLAIDRYWRVGIGPLFWKYAPDEQEALVIHECMHVTCHHYMREKAAHQTDHEMSIISQDLEINQIIRTIHNARLPKDAILPSSVINVPANRSMESYYKILISEYGEHGASAGDGDDNADNGEPSGQPSDSAGQKSKSNSDSSNGGSQSQNKDDGDDADSGNGSTGSHNKSNKSGKSKLQKAASNNPCDGKDSSDMEAEASAKGIERVSAENQSYACEHMLSEARKALSYGSSSDNKAFASLLIQSMKPPKVNWRDVLKHCVSSIYASASYRKTDYSYAKINRRSSAIAPDVILPGMTGHNPRTMMAIDTSASMGSKDLKAALYEIRGIISTNNHGAKDAFKYFCVDTQMKKVTPIKSIDEVKLSGGGGTDMSPAFAYVKSLKRRDKPDVFVLVSDGGFDWGKLEKVWPDTKVLILITDHNGMKNVTKWAESQASVVDISG